MSWDNIIIHLKQTQHIYRTCGVGSVCRDRRGTANVCSLSFTAQLFLLTDTENPPWSLVLISDRSVSTTRQLYTNSFLVTSSLRRLTRNQSGKNLGCNFQWGRKTESVDTTGWGSKNIALTFHISDSLLLSLGHFHTAGEHFHSDQRQLQIWTHVQRTVSQDLSMTRFWVLFIDRSLCSSLSVSSQFTVDQPTLINH